MMPFIKKTFFKSKSVERTWKDFFKSCSLKRNKPDFFKSTCVLDNNASNRSFLKSSPAAKASAAQMALASRLTKRSCANAGMMDANRAGHKGKASDYGTEGFAAAAVFN